MSFLEAFLLKDTLKSRKSLGSTETLAFSSAAQIRTRYVIFIVIAKGHFQVQTQKQTKETEIKMRLHQIQVEHANTPPKKLTQNPGEAHIKANLSFHLIRLWDKH